MEQAITEVISAGSYFIMLVVFLALFITIRRLDLQKYLEALVGAAEKAFDIPKSGPEKNAWVKEQFAKVNKWHWLTEDRIDAIIEATCNSFDQAQNLVQAMTKRAESATPKTPENG